jgi:transglutaminase/protease-like cytokinesis protein 3
MKATTKSKAKSAVVVSKVSSPTASPKSSKTEQVLTLLSGKTGANIEQIMQLTGWQAHSVRGFISGTVKKKLALKLDTQMLNGVRHYLILKG